MSSPQHPDLPSPSRPGSRPGSRWFRTLPWLAGLLLGTSAHIVWWTSARAPAERVVTVPSPEVHVHVHQTPPKATVVTHVKTGSCQETRQQARQETQRAQRAMRAEQARVRAQRRLLAGARGAVVCSDGGCTIRRSFLTSLLREPGLLGQGTRVRAARSEDGLKIHGVFPGSVPDLLGLRSGDTILAIDGRATRSTSDLVQQIRALDRVGAFTITVHRHGMVHTASHRVVDG